MFDRSLNIAGQKYGKLTPIRRVGKQGKAVLWLCQCDCGNETTVRLGNLRQKVRPVTSCGCNTGFENLIGRVFGRWEVLSRAGNGPQRAATWNCRCECGNTGVVDSSALRMGDSKSCGCLSVTHGMSKTVEYSIWCSMIDRCHNPNSSNYANYGARGITVCREWRESFPAFIGHIGVRPSGELSVDRIENSKGYEPGNVRWATREMQSNNKRSNIMLTHDGETLTLSQTARKYKIFASLLHSRIKRGMDISNAIKTFVKKGK